MPPYEPTLTTFERVKRQIDTTETSDDDLIKDFIRLASGDIAGATRRCFVPYKDAYTYPLQQASVLLPIGDLLSPITVTDGQGEVELSNIRLIERNIYPAYGMELVNGSNWRSSTSDDDGEITITGWWGFNENPAKMWKLRTSLDGALDEDDEEIIVADSTKLRTLDYLKIGDEIMQIVSIAVSDAPDPVHTLVVERGEMGTDAASHDHEAGIYQYQQKHDIALAATMLAQFLYQNRDKPGIETIQTPEGTTVISLDAPGIVHTVVARYAQQDVQDFSIFWRDGGMT
jgi:hypothetical protein